MESCLLYAALSTVPLALEPGWPFPKPPPAGAIEIVDLSSFTTVDTVLLPGRQPNDIAVVTDSLYVVDPLNNEVVVLTTDGKVVSTIATPSSPSYCTASAGPYSLYVLSPGAIAIIDIGSNTVRQTIEISADSVTGIAASDDGEKVCAVGGSAGAGNCWLLDVASSTVMEISLSGGYPVDVAFDGSVVALMWTGGALLQVDTSTGSQNTAATLESPYPGSFPNPKTLQYSATRKRAVAIEYVIQQIEPILPVPFGQIELFDPVGSTATDGPMLSVAPYICRLAGDGHSLLLVEGHVITGSSSDVLSIFDLASNTYRGGSYTFAVTEQYVTSMTSSCPLGGIGIAPPGFRWPLVGAGEGFSLWVDPIWDPTWGVGIAAGIGGAIGRGIAAAINRAFPSSRGPSASARRRAGGRK